MSNTIDKPLLAWGKLSEVYAWEAGQVLKLFIAGMPVEYAQHEASITQAVYAAGLPVPQVGEVVAVNGRFGITLQHINGRSLLELWLEQPTETEPIARLLADLHQQIHTTPAPPLEALPRQHDWFANNIQDTALLTEAMKTDILTTLHNLADGDRLCHGDFHPGNILVAEDGQAVVVDWFTAVSGHPLGDVAQTALLLAQAPLPPEWAATLTPHLRHKLQQQYIACYLQQNLAWQPLLTPWQAVVTAANKDTFGE